MNPNFSLTEFRTLCNQRDVAAFRAVSGAQAALAYLNLGEVEQAKDVLLRTLSFFQEADDKINQFRKENSRNGNAAA